VKRSHRVYDAIKRVLDVVGAALALLVLSPVFAVVALVVRREFGSPVLFSQVRPGRDARPFTVYKFRTMRDAAAGTSTVDAVATDAGRLTPLGRRLRSSSLDELPEFWNVLKGDMSVVGPRPLLTEYLDRYNEQQARRHEVRPGITGWAQVNGRNAVDWPKRLAMDVWYVDNRSFLLDVRILAKTIGAVFGRHGISAPGSATMTPFDPREQAGRREGEEDS
jgi:lipopolysaccharide/colanic/teichoic acid biosynthesis glycosyltransferase